MAARWRLVVLVAALAAAAASEAGAEEGGWDPVIRMPGEEEPTAARGGERLDDEDDDVGTRWAVLVAGSSGYGNYRHQVSAVSEAVSLPCTLRVWIAIPTEQNVMFVSLFRVVQKALRKLFWNRVIALLASISGS
jgi:hypothetical protein